MEPVVALDVEKLMTIGVMAGSEIMAGSKGISRKISKLNIMEVPDIVNWVSKGEFILTTAYSLRDNVEKLKDLIIEFNRKGVAGLGIKINRYITEVPEDTLRLADEMNFPIIKVPFNASFSAIISEALENTVERQVEVFDKLNTINNELFSILINGGKINDILSKIHEIMDKNTICFIDHVLNENIIFTRNLVNKTMYEDMLIEEQLQYMRRFQYIENIRSNIVEESYVVIRNKKIKRYIIHIYIKGYPHASLVLYEDEMPINSIFVKALESASTIVALQITNSLAILEVESNHMLEFIENLLSLNVEKYNKAIEKSKIFNFDYRLDNAVAYIKFTHSEDELTNVVMKKEQRLANMIDKLNKSSNLNILTGIKNDGLILIIGNKTHESAFQFKDRIIRFCSDLIYKAPNYGINDRLCIGIGKTYTQTVELGKSYKEAQHCIDYLKYKDKNVIHYDSLGIYRILTNENITSELIDIYRDNIYQLVLYDREKNTNMVDTMRKYFEHSGNVKKISDDMFSHYNTIVYRLNRIKQIINLDFENYEDMLNLQISLKILDLMGEKKLDSFMKKY